MDKNTQVSMQEVVDDMPIGELKNEEGDVFWYKALEGKSPFAEENRGRSADWQRYAHEKGKVGDVFYDGNNGDKWKVVAINTEYHRAAVENKTQGGVKLVYWQ